MNNSVKRKKWKKWKKEKIKKIKKKDQGKNAEF